MYEISTKHEKQSPLRAPATLFWQKTRQQAARVPIKAWIVLGLFTVAAILMALYTASLAKTATLHLKVQHGFRSAQIYLWVDGDLAYSGKLTGSAKKKFGLKLPARKPKEEALAPVPAPSPAPAEEADERLDARHVRLTPGPRVQSDPAEPERV